MMCIHEVIRIVPTYLGIVHVPHAVKAKEMLKTWDQNNME